MKQYLYIALFCFIFSIAAKAQNPSIVDTFYYSFKDDIQMIELVYIEDFIDNIRNFRIDKDKRQSLFMDSKVNYANVYIFRDRGGKILNIYGKNSKDLDINNLRPIADNFFTADFLLYQYSLTSYSDKDSVLFPFTADDEKKGIINQKGEIIVEAIYDEFYRVKSNVIVANEEIVLFLDEQENNIVNIGRRLNYNETNYRRNYTDFIFFDNFYNNFFTNFFTNFFNNSVFSIYHKRNFLIYTTSIVRFQEDYRPGGRDYKPYERSSGDTIYIHSEPFFMKSKVEAEAAEKDKK